MTETTETTDEQIQDDGVAITPTGLVHLVIDGEHYWLRRPKIGEMRDRAEAAAEVGKMQIRVAARAAEALNAKVADVEAAVQAEDGQAVGELVQQIGDDVAEAAEDEEAVGHAALDWWQGTVALLERSGRKLPDDHDDLPGWLLNLTLIGETRKAWLRLPWLAVPPK